MLTVLVCACTEDYSEEYYAEYVANTKIETNNKVKDFESEYIANHCLATRAGNTIKLIGYKTVAYHGEDSIFVNKLWEHAKKEIEEHGSFLTLDGQVRVYCPMREAIIKLNGKTYVADSLGQIYDFPIEYIGNIKVSGRDESGHSIYTKFETKLTPKKFYEEQNVLIFDLGIKDKYRPSLKISNARIRTRSESENDDDDDDKIACIKNHLPSRNCTEAFDCSQGRCTTYYDRCMDYNGFFTDCSGSHWFFTGSDCSVAMALGECWNEIM